MRRPKILIISYLFPPAGGIAVQRALSLAKYLPDCGFEVHVLRARGAAAPVRDPELLRRIPPGVKVHAAFAPEIPFRLRHAAWALLSRPGKSGAAPSVRVDRLPPAWKQFATRGIKRIFCPEPEVLWVPFAVRKARRIIRRHGIDAVLITAPPFSTFLAGVQLKREFPQLRLICDFRDEWLSFYLKDFEFQSSEATRRRAAEIEREAVEAADLVVAVTESSLQEIRARYPEQADRKFFLLPNGYDPEAFANFRPRPHTGSSIVVTHVGTVYKTASPAPYLDALDTMPEELRSRIDTRFVGRISNDERRVLEGRSSRVDVLGFMPQEQALRQMESADYLLLTMTNEISLPGKLPEYLATGKPILAISPRGGEVDRMLQRTGAGWCVPPDDHAAIQAMLKDAIDAVDAGGPREARNEQAIRGLTRPALTAAYAAAIRTLWDASGQDRRELSAVVGK